MMRAVGGALMEAGTQATNLRKEEIELKRQQNLKAIADGRQGLMREQMILTREGQRSMEEFNTQRLAGMQTDRESTSTYRQTDLEGRQADRVSRAEYQQTVVEGQIQSQSTAEESAEAAARGREEQQIATLAFRDKMLDLDTARSSETREDAALDSLREEYHELDVDSPANRPRREYMRRHDMLISGMAKDMASQPEISQAIGELQAVFADEQTRGLSATERKIKRRELRAHMDKVDTFYRTGNAIMGRITSWTESGLTLQDVLQQSGAMKSDMNRIEEFDSRLEPFGYPLETIPEDGEGGLMEPRGRASLGNRMPGIPDFMTQGANPFEGLMSGIMHGFNRDDELDR